ncbi:uncharacterized protein LOC130824971 isoform X1 [Amaranthus tricolor]|nr:uncharacterized protein LOC130824971 isoform X1 [Amaranthus tricolor]
MICDLFQTDLQTYAHKYMHPLSIIKDSSDSNCKHCKNKCKDLIRYHCNTCNKMFHLACAVHPTRLLSFLHPNHELELKTRPIDARCNVCYHSGKSNARVYCCKTCKFYVHPDCAIKFQYVKSLIHVDHILVFRPLPSYESAVCKGCNRECKRWRYTCSVCEGVNYHEDCLLRYEIVRSNASLEEVGHLCKRSFVKAFKDGFKDGFKDDFKDDMKEQFHDESVWDLIAQFLEALFS